MGNWNWRKQSCGLGGTALGTTYSKPKIPDTLPTRALSCVSTMLFIDKPYWAHPIWQISLHRQHTWKNLISQKDSVPLPKYKKPRASGAVPIPRLMNWSLLEGVSAHTEAVHMFYSRDSWRGISTCQVTSKRFPDILGFHRKEIWGNSKMQFRIWPAKIWPES